MPIYVRDIKLGLDEPEERLVERLAARLRVPRQAIRAYAPVRRSLDARKSENISFVYCVELALDDSLENEQRLVAKLRRDDVKMLKPSEVPDPVPGSEPMRHRPIVVGFGPAGMFAAWQLARLGYRPVVLERGQAVRDRHRDVMQKFYRQGIFNPESNLLYGEGGAGAYSDGKLYTRINDPYVQVILRTFFQHGADPSILIDGQPHIGSDRLPNICMRMRRRIEEMGGEIRFGARLDDLIVDDTGRLTAIRVNEPDQSGPVLHTLQTDHVLLAIGHSARDTLRMLAGRGVKIEAKPFQLGVRIEHPQALVNQWQYKQSAGHSRLPPAHYHAVAKEAGGTWGDMFTFCMCPGGMILPTNESAGLIVTNGASRSARAGEFANSGLVVTVPPAQFRNDPLQGLAYQHKWEALAFQSTGGSYAVPAQRACDLLKGRDSDGQLQTSYPLESRWATIAQLLPSSVIDSLVRGLRLLDERWPGFAGDDAIVTAPETRASAPVRIRRSSQTRESIAVSGLYPVGEGAGYAGGIMSAAIDGLKTADTIIESMAPP